MLAHERKQVILAALEASGVVRTIDLATELGVTDQTIRRDLLDLEERGLLRRLHGGATTVNYDGLAFDRRAELRHDEKEWIAREAVALVRPNSTVALGPGTTTERIAAQLGGFGLQVITNSLAVAQGVPGDDVETYVTGGRFRSDGQVVTGNWALQNLNEVFADISFVGISGVGESEGWTVTERDEAEALRQLIRIAKRTVIVTDSTKFHRVARQSVAPLSAAHALITDADLEPEHARMLERAGVSVTVALPENQAAAEMRSGEHGRAAPPKERTSR